MQWAIAETVAVEQEAYTEEDWATGIEVVEVIVEGVKGRHTRIDNHEIVAGYLMKHCNRVLALAEEWPLRSPQYSRR